MPPGQRIANERRLIPPSLPFTLQVGMPGFGGEYKEHKWEEVWEVTAVCPSLHRQTFRSGALCFPLQRRSAASEMGVLNVWDGMGCVCEGMRKRSRPPRCEVHLTDSPAAHAGAR